MPMLLADIQDILGAIVPVLFVIFWVISQVIGGINKARKGRGVPPPDRPPQKVPTSPEEDALAKEIERFLGQKREPSLPREQIPGPSDSVVTAEVARSSATDSTIDAPPRGPLPGAGDDQRDRGKGQRKVSLRKQVSSTQQPTGAALPKQPRQSNGSRQFTSLQTSAPAPATMNSGAEQNAGILELPDSAAADSNPWQAMISDPTTLRQAFLLSQIFSRPEDRW